ncbi:MAG: ATP-binding cassette domain-containing protein [Acidiferrobacteraceae bacterium]|jgi:ATP-binding cassette subfamily F protein uup
MSLLSLNKVSLAYGHHPLLDEVDFQIEPKERVCLVGRNGTGKSTLLRVISGAAAPDDGEIWYPETLRISHLEQEVPLDSEDTLFEFVAEGLGSVGNLLAEYHRLAGTADKPALARLHVLQTQIELADGWNLDRKVETVLSRLDLPAERRIRECSGGYRRRALLARALVSDPDLLLLDEPTNHMDIAAITWLEEFLLDFRGALIFITHDRTFLQNLATRIIELDRGHLTSYPGDFANYLRRRDEMLENEVRANARFDKELAEHEAWIRRGIKARRTRNEGRVRKLEAMRQARRQRIDTPGRASLDAETGETSGKLVADLRDVSFSYDGVPIIRNFSTRILRGDRIGIIGPNGSGKSTLLRLILGELKPQQGRVVLGTRLTTAYFDQQRSQLEPDKSVRDNLSDGNDYVQVRGKPRHVIGYLKQFLFPPERVDSPVSILSGGERNRLLLARMFTRPANMLVMDEPTNDLDVDTLELLEDLLTDYEGTLLLVSHDRSFLDNIVTSTMVFEGSGTVEEFVGGYADYLHQRGTPARPAPSPAAEPRSAPTPRPRTREKQKLSYKESRELEALPARIESMEAEVARIETRAAQPEFYQQDNEAIAAAMTRLNELREELQKAYARWEELETFAP